MPQKLSKLKVTIVSTYDNYGGASIAALRLHQSLLKAGIESNMLVKEKNGNDEKVFSISTKAFQKKISFLKFAAERLYFLRFEKNKSVRFAFSPANIGSDISSHPLILEADVIHLHWVNFGFLSLQSLKKLFALNKPIVWTFHDMWAFTGGCHYSHGCNNYQSHCNGCPFLSWPSPHDLSWQIFEKKEKLFINTPFKIITCSNWLNKITNQSALLGRFNISTIHNPIDTDFFVAGDKIKAREKFQIPLDKKIILFGAVNTSDPRKGFNLLIGALNILQTNNCLQNVELMIFGKSDEKIIDSLPLKVHSLGKLGPSQIVDAYSAADILVLPSVEDNLPNTVAEAMSCSLPVVAFNAGGLPEMVDHLLNGFLARPLSAQSLAEGINKLLFNADDENFKLSARKKALNSFSEKINTQKYIEVYQTSIK